MEDTLVGRPFCDSHLRKGLSRSDPWRYWISASALANEILSRVDPAFGLVHVSNALSYRFDLLHPLTEKAAANQAP